MKINVLRKMRYQNTFIYIMQFNYVFQYLFSWNGEIHENHIDIKPSLKQQFMFELGLWPKPFNAEVEEEMEKVLLSGAMASIDKIIEEGGDTRQAKKRQERNIADVENTVKIKAGLPCQWRAIDTKDGFYYECLTHGMAVKMKDGQKPEHEDLSTFQPEVIT